MVYLYYTLNFLFFLIWIDFLILSIKSLFYLHLLNKNVTQADSIYYEE